MTTRLIVLPTCPICQDENINDSYLFTLCGHSFHSSCIRKWDQTQRHQKRITKCPCCNSILKRISTTTTNHSTNNHSLGSRFVLIHSLSEKIIHDDDHQNNSSSPILSNQPLTQSAQDEDHQKLLQEIHQSKHKLVKQETEIASLNQSNQSIKTQNNELLNQIKSLKVDLSLIKNREKLGINQLSKELALEKSSRKEALRVLRNEFMELQDAYNQKKSSLIRLSSERDEIQRYEKKHKLVFLK